MKTLFKNKRKNSTSFNLTSLARRLLADAAVAGKMSQSDMMETLIRNQATKPALRPWWDASGGPKGGRPSFFPGKDRGTTTAVCLSQVAYDELHEQVLNTEINNNIGRPQVYAMSRGDYVEFLIRKELGKSEDLP